MFVRSAVFLIRMISRSTYLLFLKQSLKRKISLHWLPQDYGKVRSYEDAINTYKLAAYCALIKKEKKVTIAGLYLRTAWLYRDAQDKEQERRFINLAAHEYIECLFNRWTSGSLMSETKLLYIHRRITQKTGKISRKQLAYFPR